MKNKLIVFEGIDGVGKTTLSKLLQKKLVKAGYNIVRYENIEDKNGGFNKIKPFIKTKVPINSSLFFYIASALYKSQQIEKLLKHNWVICDRYIYSTYAYHTIRNANMSLIPDIKKIPIRLPDFVFLIKVDDDIRLQRAKTRSDNNIHDGKAKTKNNIVGRMEKELELFKPIIIDNSGPNVFNALKKIYTVIKINLKTKK